MTAKENILVPVALDDAQPDMEYLQSLAQSKVVFTGDSNCRLNMKKRNRYNC